MAIIAGTVLAAYRPDFVKGTPQTNVISTVGYTVKTCMVDVIWKTGSYVQADDCTFAPIAAIQASERNGKTPVILQACPVDSGRYFLTATPTTVTLPFAGACTNAAGTITTNLTLGDLTTEHTNAFDMTTVTWTRPITFAVSYYEPVA